MKTGGLTPPLSEVFTIDPLALRAKIRINGLSNELVRPGDDHAQTCLVPRRSRLVWRTLTGLLVALALTATRGAHAQGCVPPERPYFDFQVQQPARFVGDTTYHPRPAANPFASRTTDSLAFIVQFVVDTTGRADPRTLRALRVPSQAAMDSVRAMVAKWVFTPAVLAGCRVPQLLQTSIVR